MYETAIICLQSKHSSGCQEIFNSRFAEAAMENMTRGPYDLVYILQDLLHMPRNSELCIHSTEIVDCTSMLDQSGVIMDFHFSCFSCHACLSAAALPLPT